MNRCPRGLTPRSLTPRGFTLVEVVVALALLAVILAGLISALVTFAKSAERADARILASDDVRLVYAFLQQSLAEASPHLYQRPGDLVTQSWLHGTNAELEWLGLMPARHGVGGLYHLRLGIDASGDLVLGYLPYVGDDPGPDWSLAGNHLLLRGLDRFELSYRALDDTQWRPEWPALTVLPGRVQITIGRAREQWPPLVVPVLAAEPLVDIQDAQGFEGLR